VINAVEWIIDLKGLRKIPNFDDIDRKIIRALVADARLSFP